MIVYEVIGHPSRMEVAAEAIKYSTQVGFVGGGSAGHTTAAGRYFPAKIYGHC
jgi:hypothetical protein